MDIIGRKNEYKELYLKNKVSTLHMVKILNHTTNNKLIE